MSTTHRPPLLKRVPPRVRTAVAWGAAVLYVPLTLVAVATERGSRNTLEGAVPAVVMLLLVGLLRRQPLLTMALLVAGFYAQVVTMKSSTPQVSEYAVITVAVCVIAATRPRRVSLGAAAIAVAAPIIHTVYPVDVVAPAVTHPYVMCLSDGTTCLKSMPPFRPDLTGSVPSGGSGGLDLPHLETIGALVLVIAVAWLIGDSIRQRRDHAEAIRVQATVQAVTAERLRIARELHDMVAHSIGIIAIQSGVGSRVISTQPEEARNALTAIEATSRETLSGLRRMLVALRRADEGTSAQAAAAPLDPAPGLADVDHLAATTTANAGVRVDVEWRGERRPLPQDIDLSAFRIIQEALTNVVRHSGTRYCRVTIDQRAGELGIEINDSGRGVDAGHGLAGSAGSAGSARHSVNSIHAGGGGFGLVGMRERVGLLHGRFEAGPRAGGGFRVAVVLPIDGRTLQDAVGVGGSADAKALREAKASKPAKASKASKKTGSLTDADATDTRATEPVDAADAAVAGLGGAL